MDSDVKTLKQDEKLALVALVKAVIMADGHVSTEEVEELQDLVDMLGKDTYQGLIDEVETRLRGDDVVRKFLGTITDQNARETIYRAILKVAMADSVDASESELLAWLAQVWDVQVFFDEPTR